MTFSGKIVKLGPDSAWLRDSKQLSDEYYNLRNISNEKLKKLGFIFDCYH